MDLRSRPEIPLAACRPRARRLRRSAAGALAVALVIAPLPVTALDRGATPLEVEVSPSSSVAGGTISISGRSVVLGEKRSIPIRIDLPDGTQRELVAALSADNNFSRSFAETTQTGDYRVTIFTADRRDSVERSFTVQDSAAFRRQATERMTVAFRVIEEETDDFAETIARAPVSAPREELEEEVEELRVLLADVDKYLMLLDQSVEALEEAVEGGGEGGGHGAGGTSEAVEPKPGADPDATTSDKPQSVPGGAPQDPTEGVGEPKPGADPDATTSDKPQSVPGGAPQDPTEGVGEPKPGAAPDATSDKPQSVPGGAPQDPTEGVGEPKPGADPDATTGESPPSGPGESGPSPSADAEPESAPAPDSGSGGARPGGTGASGGGGEARAREELRELHEEMGRAADEVEKMRKSFSEQIAKFDYDHTLCDGLHYVQQAWKSMTVAISTTKKLASLALGKVGKVAAELGVSEGGGSLAGEFGDLSPESAFARSQAVSSAKAFVTDSLTGFKALENLSKGLVSYGIESVFQAVCERYVGPFEGKMIAEVFVEQGRFYAYETRIEGEVRLRYERGAEGVIPVTGEFEGVATWFNLDEDLWRIQPAVKRDVMLRWTMRPLPSAYIDSAGTFGRVLLSPNYFYVPVHGLIEGDRIQFELEPATQDFDKSTTAIYVMVNLSVPFPHVMIQEIPHEGANYILTRALRDTPQLKVVVHREEGYSEATESFAHQASTPDNMIKVSTEVELRVCNPKCP